MNVNDENRNTCNSSSNTFTNNNHNHNNNNNNSSSINNNNNSSRSINNNKNSSRSINNNNRHSHANSHRPNDFPHSIGNCPCNQWKKQGSFLDVHFPSNDNQQTESRPITESRFPWNNFIMASEDSVQEDDCFSWSYPSAVLTSKALQAKSRLTMFFDDNAFYHFARRAASFCLPPKLRPISRGGRGHQWVYCFCATWPRPLESGVTSRH
ncbi:hypothetical protein ElyMa_003223400 [Elysia marginata]|uniref:Uncharacterized protein n=1 Tax=Elysia marginata TaxID=1093978 RepID=A0AAV4J5P8_9GAST|nr:hypothetical protein ElyMa_003223400 [Elysia marginata]